MRCAMLGLWLLASSAAAGAVDGSYRLDDDFQVTVRTALGQTYMQAAFHPCYRMEPAQRARECHIPVGTLMPMPWATLSSISATEYALDSAPIRLALTQEGIDLLQDPEHPFFGHRSGPTLHLQRAPALQPRPPLSMPRVQAGQLSEFQGVYTENGQFDIRVRLEGQYLSARPSEGPAMLLYPQGNDLFFTRFPPMAAQFERGPDGHVERMRWFMEGAMHLFERQPLGTVARVPPNTDIKSCKTGGPVRPDAERGRFLAVDQVASAALGTSVPLCVYLPPAYDNLSTHRFPVVFGTDGEYIESLVALLERLHMQVVVIGLGGFEARELNLLLPGARDYFAFVVNEAIPYVEQRYRVDPARRILMGHSLGGAFVAAAALLDDPAQRAFNQYFASDASFWAEPLQFAKLLQEPTNAPRTAAHLVLTGAGKGNGANVAATYRQMTTSPSLAAHGLRVEWLDYPEETHGSVLVTALEQELPKWYGAARAQDLHVRVDGKPVRLSAAGEGVAFGRLELAAGTHTVIVAGRSVSTYTVPVTGRYALRLDGGARAPVLSAVVSQFTDQPVYIRGSMNDWGLTHPMKIQDPTHLVADIELPAGEHEFKVASSDFQTLDLGARSGQDLAQPARTYPTQAGGMNFRLKTSIASRWRFTLDVTDEMHPLVSVAQL